MKPYSLIDLGALMRIYGVGELTDLQSFLCSVVVGLFREHHTTTPLQHDQFLHIRSKIQRYAEVLEEMYLPVSASKAKRILEWLDAAEAKNETHLFSGQNKHNLLGDAENLANLVGDELKTKLVMIMPSEKTRYFMPSTPIFQKSVVDKFPNNLDDMFEAGNCFALGRYTACVFHLMRLMESGVQQFGETLGVVLIDSKGKDKMWQNILDEANKAIKAMDQHSPKTKSYAALSALLYNVKLSWRNEVMHPKETYSEEQAELVISATKAFMNELSLVV